MSLEVLLPREPGEPAWTQGCYDVKTERNGNQIKREWNRVPQVKTSASSGKRRAVSAPWSAPSVLGAPVVERKHLCGV